MVSSERIFVDKGAKVLAPSVWLYRLAQVNSEAKELVQGAAEMWSRGDRRASVLWFQQLLELIETRVQGTRNSVEASRLLRQVIERLEQEAFKVEVFWLIGVPADANARNQVEKQTDRLGDLPFNALGIRRG
jgi:hypothetical protein